MLQAMSTGHDGSLSTAHANSPRHLVWRLETMALMSDVALPVGHVREQIASALDVVVHLARLPDGRRVLTDVAAVEGVRDGEPLLVPVCIFDRVNSTHRVTGELPAVAAMLRDRGQHLPSDLFREGPDTQGPSAPIRVPAPWPIVPSEIVREPVGAAG